MRYILILACVVALLTSCGGAAVPAAPTPAIPTPIRPIVTIRSDDGRGGTLDTIDVTSSYDPRGETVTQLRPGTKVTVLRRYGDGILIRTDDGTQGWVDYWVVGLKRR